MGVETQGKGRQSLLLPPPLPIGASRAVRHRKGRGGGRSGGLKDLETGQVASRAVPVPGPMADPGTQAATADPGTQAATADPGTQAATAEQGAQAAMAEQGARVAMAEQGAWAAMAEQGARAAMAEQRAWDASMAEQGAWDASVAEQEAWEAMEGSQPPQIFLGKLDGTSGGQGGAGRDQRR